MGGSCVGGVEGREVGWGWADEVWVVWRDVVWVVLRG